MNPQVASKGGNGMSKGGFFGGEGIMLILVLFILLTIIGTEN
jgi:uncharacterized protein (TIGR01732 family)